MAERGFTDAAGELRALVALIDRPPLDDVLLEKVVALRVAAAIRTVLAAHEELRSAAFDLMTWFPAKPSDPEWRIKGGRHGADDAVSAVRALIQEKGNV